MIFLDFLSVLLRCLPDSWTKFKEFERKFILQSHNCAITLYLSTIILFAVYISQKSIKFSEMFLDFGERYEFWNPYKLNIFDLILKFKAAPRKLFA